MASPARVAVIGAGSWGTTLAVLLAQKGVPVAALQMARRLGVEMPITEQVHAVVFENKDPRQAMLDLMTRTAKHELE